MSKSYLDNRVVIFVTGSNGINRYFNRNTQGFTARLDEHGFYDTRGASINVYFNSFRRHSQSESIWQAMSENDTNLQYWKSTIGNLIKKGSM